MNKKDIFRAITEAPFPAVTRARVSIMGLAYCDLALPDSTINFLTHVPGHQVVMTVLRKTVGPNSAAFPPKHYKIEAGEKVKLTSTGPAPGHIRNDKGPYPLIAMINLPAVHRIPANVKIVPVNDPPETTELILSKCSFYTALTHPAPYKFVENIAKPADVTKDETGFILGGHIPSKDLTDVIEITLGEGGPNPFILRLPAVFTDTNNRVELVYDIIFNNHCLKRGICKDQVTKLDSEGNTIEGTDFFFYYEALMEEGNPHRRFEMVEVSEGDRFATSPYELSTTDGDANQQSGTGEVAACDPVITEPREPYN